MTKLKAFFAIIFIFALDIAYILLIASTTTDSKIFLIFCFIFGFCFLLWLIIDYIVGRPKKLIVGHTYKFWHCFKTENGYYLVAPGNEIYLAHLILAAGSVDIVELLNSGRRIKVVGEDGNFVYIKEV
jgi:hypothetical protein